VTTDFPVDLLGEPYTAETIGLGDDDEGPVVTTLVKRPADAPTTKAVLYVHGFNDYFFNTEYAEWWTARGYDFYALDLRKYGRSLREWQTPNYAADLSEYYEDLDAAWGRIVDRDGHTEVVGSAHSTGGLILALWADEGPPALTGVVLNAPWVDFHGPFLMRTVGTAAVKQLGARQPKRELPRTITTYYGDSLHRDFDGEWDYDLRWKTRESWPVYAGWLSAIRRGHAELQSGLDLRCPVLVLSSASTLTPTSMTDEVHHHDIVLDVDQIRRWSTQLGHHLTYVAVEGAVHDVFLSRAEPRARCYDEVERWLSAYVEGCTDPSRRDTM